MHGPALLHQGLLPADTDALLARYFQGRGLFDNPDFSAMKEDKPDELFRGLAGAAGCPAQRDGRRASGHLRPVLRKGVSGYPRRGALAVARDPGGQLLLIEVNDFHFGFLANELAGVHEGAVPRTSQARSLRRPNRRRCCGDWAVHSPHLHKTSRSGYFPNGDTQN